MENFHPFLRLSKGRLKVGGRVGAWSKAWGDGLRAWGAGACGSWTPGGMGQTDNHSVGCLFLWIDGWKFSPCSIVVPFESAAQKVYTKFQYPIVIEEPLNIPEMS